MSRPILPASSRRARVVAVRLTPGQYADMRRLADAHRQSQSEFLRSLISAWVAAQS